MQGRQAVAQTGKEALKQMRSTVTEKVDGKEYYIHTVRRGQTLYMISKAYGVEVNDLIRENPQVKEGIKADQQIRIPVPGSEKKPAPQPKQVVTETKPVKKDTAAMAELLPCGKDSSTKKAVYKVALMLPLFLGEVDKIKVENPDPKELESVKSFQFLPFYEGFLIALDSLKKSGIRVKLYVYDVDKDTAKTKQILRKPEMRSMDLIVGLLYTRNFQLVADFAKKNKINLVNPVSERSELVNGNPYVFKVQPSKKGRLAAVAACLAKSYDTCQIIIIRNGQYPDRDAPDQVKKECTNLGLPASIVEGQEAAIAKLSKSKSNCLVVFSDNAAYVFDLTRRFFELRNQYSLTVVGLPDWSALEGLESEYLVALKTNVVASSFIDYHNPLVKGFVRKYQAEYQCDPELLAFQGYDVATCFLTALHRYGKNIQRCLGEMQVNLLESRFDFRQEKGNGFENRHWPVYRYENYRLVKVN